MVIGDLSVSIDSVGAENDPLPKSETRVRTAVGLLRNPGAESKCRSLYQVLCSISVDQIKKNLWKLC